MFEFKPREAIPCMKLRDRIRTNEVTRFHMVRTARKQTVAEHCYNVAMIARSLAEELRVPVNNVVWYSLIHDSHESITGDIPTPFKRHIQENSDYTFLESVKEVDPEMWYLRQDLSFDELMIVEIADMIEALVFLETEGMGNHAKRVGIHLHRKLQQAINLSDNRMNESATRWSEAVEKVLNELKSETTVDINDD